MTLRRVLVGERINQPSGHQIRKKLRQSRTADGFKMRPGFIYTVVRAISARVNQNYDGWPADELKKSYHTFIGKPVFVNHENYDPKLARGVVVAARYVENGKDCYVECIQEIDAKRYPKLAHEIKTGGLDSVSMGAEAAFTICSYCKHKATDESDMCEHVRFRKGDHMRKFDRRTGKVEDILIYESCHKLSFFELSYVFDPADETAVASKVLVAGKISKDQIPSLPIEYGTPERKIINAASSSPFHDENGRYMGPMKTKTNYPPDPYGDSDHCPECGLHFAQGHAPGCSVASKWGKKMSYEQQVLAAAGYKLAWGETEAPPEVDTLREEGSAPEDDNDDFHHYVESPSELQTPDLAAAGNIDREQDQTEQQQPGAPAMPGQPPAGPPQPQPQMMTLQIPMPPQQGQIPQQAFSAVQIPRTTVAYFNDYFGTDVEDVTLRNGHGVSGTSRNPRKGTTMGRSGSTLAERGKVASRGRRQHFAEGPNFDGGDRSRNDQGEQEEAFIAETPPEEPVEAPTDDTPNISNTEENLVAKVQRGRQQLLKDAQALAAMQAQKRNGSQHTAEAVETPDEYNPTVDTGPAGEELTGDSFESLGEPPVETQPKDASLHAFQAFDRWLHKATGRQARDLTEIGIKRAATEYAKRARIDAQSLFPALGIVLRQARKNEAAIKAAAAKKGAPMRKRADEKLEVAAPDDRIDVEAPVSNTTDEAAQASQFDLHDFGDNAGDNVADPELSVDSQIWAPGEGEKKSSRKAAPQKQPVKAGGILAVRCAEAYINAGLEPDTQERKYQLVGLFEGMNRGAVQRDIALLERVASVQSQQRQKVASGRTRGAATPIPPGLTQGGTRRSASTRRTSANDPVNDSLLFG